MIQEHHLPSQTCPPDPIIWPRKEWQARRQAHLDRVAALADAFVERRSRRMKHPVHDFLFTYYSFSPARLKQWSPPPCAAIEIDETDLATMPWLAKTGFRRAGSLLSLDARALTENTRTLARWVAALCQAILDRPPRFRCYGLHEWAIVYRQSADELRHQGWELRMAPAELAVFVESQALCCTHYDAFRFFTPQARPLNAFQPCLEQRIDLEQAACLHACMDLYKWAHKLAPWSGADLIGECFALACEGRDLDMRASPYDLRHLGYEPVPIETPEGRAHYEQEQRALAAKATPLRVRLRDAAAFIATWETAPAAA